jgi:chromosome partitioning protein
MRKRTHMRTIAIANAKGGTCKTTFAVHLATGLARDRRVLLVDLDPQANATGWLLGPLAREQRGVAEVLTQATAPGPGELVDVPRHERLKMLPATQALASVDSVLAAEVAGERALAEALAPLESDFDAVIIDCPPTMGILVLTALCAADAVIAPVLPAFLSLSGLSKLESTVERVRRRLNASTRVAGYVLIGADPREAITTEVRDVLAKEAGDRLFRTQVRVSTAAKALPARHALAWDAGADRRGAEDYPAVLAETLERLGMETSHVEEKTHGNRSRRALHATDGSRSARAGG